MPNTPRKTPLNDGSAESKREAAEVSQKVKKLNISKKSATERKGKVKINSRVVFAPGGQGGNTMVKKETGFASMFKKSKPAPSAPTIGVAKSHIYGEGNESEAEKGASAGAVEQESMKEWVPDKRNDPYGYWRVVKQAAEKQSKATTRRLQPATLLHLLEPDQQFSWLRYQHLTPAYTCGMQNLPWC